MVFTLDELVEYALINNPAVLSARKGVGIAEGAVMQADLLLQANPELESGSFWRGGQERENFTEWDVTLGQEFEIAGQRKIRRSLARDKLHAARATAADTERQVSYEVKQLYARYAFTKRLGQIQLQVLSFNRAILDIAEKRLAVGDVAEFQVRLAELEVQRAETERLIVARQLQASLKKLCTSLGLSPDCRLELRDDLRYRPVEISADECVRLALEKRPDFQAAQFERSSAMGELRLAQRVRYPNVTFFLNYQREEDEDIAGGGLSLPLPLFNRNPGGVHAGQSRVAMAELGVQETALRIKQEVQTSLEDLSLAASEVEAYERQILPRVAESLEAIRQTYLLGEADLAEVILLRKELIDAERGYLTALSSYYSAAFALEAAMGIPRLEALCSRPPLGKR